MLAGCSGSSSSGGALALACQKTSFPACCSAARSQRSDTGVFRRLLQAAGFPWLEDPAASLTILAPTDLAMQVSRGVRDVRALESRSATGLQALAWQLTSTARRPDTCSRQASAPDDASTSCQACSPCLATCVQGSALRVASFTGPADTSTQTASGDGSPGGGANSTGTVASGTPTGSSPGGSGAASPGPHASATQLASVYLLQRAFEPSQLLGLDGQLVATQAGDTWPLRVRAGAPTAPGVSRAGRGLCLGMRGGLKCCLAL